MTHLVFFFILLFSVFCHAKPKNIIFVMTEDQSYHLGHFGTKGIQTPNLDRFCENGYVFERGFALSPVCSPSKMALLSGTYPHTNSAFQNVQPSEAALFPRDPNRLGTTFPLPENQDYSITTLGGIHEDLPTLVELLNQNGIFTALSSKSHTQPVRKFPWQRGYGNINNTRTSEGSIEILNQIIGDADGKPFFFWYNIAAPHLPFPNQLQVNGLWDPNGGLLGDGGATNVSGNEIDPLPFYPDVPAVRQDMADYLANIESIDTVYGEFENHLKSIGLYEDTLIIYTSDHGLGLHRAKQSIYGAGLHVPLMFGGGYKVHGNRSTKQPVSHLDLAPTILDFWNIKTPDTMIGKSLIPIVTGEIDEIPDRETILVSNHEKYDARGVTDGRYYYIENLRKPSGDFTQDGLRKSLNTDQFTLAAPWFNRTFDATVNSQQEFPHAFDLLNQIVTGQNMPDFELYDMENDFWMVDNLIDDPTLSDTVEYLRSELKRWRAITQDFEQDSPNEFIRRDDITEVPPLNLPEGSFDYTENFNTSNQPIQSLANWTLADEGNPGTTFSIINSVVDGPPGANACAEFTGTQILDDQSFCASIDVSFDGNGVGAGLALGIQGNTYFQLLLKDGRSGAGGANLDFIAQKVTNGQSSPFLFSREFISNYPNGFSTGSAQFFKMQVIGMVGSPLVNITIKDPSGNLYYRQDGLDLGEPILAEQGIGLTTWFSNTALFDNFSLKLTENTADSDGDGMNDIEEINLKRDPESARDLRFDFNSPDRNNFQGWQPRSGTTSLSTVNTQKLRVSSLITEPSIENNEFNFNSTECPILLVGYSSNAAGTLEVQFKNDSQEYSSSRTVAAEESYTLNSGFQVARFNMNTNPGWTGTINSLSIRTLGLTNQFTDIEWIIASGDLDNDGIADFFDLDKDGDGAPDRVELIYGTDPNRNIEGSLDSDNDGESDLFEIIAGHSPDSLENSARIRIRNRLSDGSNEIFFNGKKGRKYFIYESDTPDSALENWTLVEESNILTDDLEITLDRVFNLEETKFYRISAIHEDLIIE